MIVRRGSVFRFMIAVGALVALSPAHGEADVDNDALRCGRAVVVGSNRIVRGDSRALSRCTLAILTPATVNEIADTCAKLRTPALRLDRVDEHTRSRIMRRCDSAVPTWLPDACRGPGPATGAALWSAPPGPNPPEPRLCALRNARPPRNPPGPPMEGRAAAPV